MHTYIYCTVKLILIVLVFPSICWSAALVGSGVTVGASCDAGQNEVGYRGTVNDNAYTPADYSRVVTATADCSGNLGDAYFYNDRATAVNVRVCVYNDGDQDGDPRDGTNDEVECVNIACGAAVDLYTAAMAGSVGVTQSTMYFVVISVEDAGVSARPAYDSGGNHETFYKSASGFYASDPADLSSESLGYNASSYNLFKAYVTIE